MRRAYAALVVALVGCDPTGGISDSADAALPSVKRYFDGPGQKLASGPWSRVVVDLDADTLYHVGARRLDDAEPTFHLFGADARDGCEIAPNAGTWLMGKPEPAPFRVLPFLEGIDERGRGRLRFATLDCQVQELAVEDAGRPYPRLYERGYLVPTGQGYTFADPWKGETYPVADRLQSVLVWNDAILLWADDELKSFSEQFEPGTSWGHELESVVGFKDDHFLAEDADGIHHVVLDHRSLELTEEDVLPDTCRLQHSSIVSNDAESVWIMAAQPCDSPEPSLLRLDRTSLEVRDALKLPFAVDSRYARAVVAPGPAGEEPTRAALYLTDVDDAGRGTLWAWQEGTEAPIQLGEHADLDAVGIGAIGNQWAGAAQVNYRTIGSYLAHDWVYFAWDGHTSAIAEDVVRNSASGELLVNFDGVAGDLPEFDGTGYRVVAERVPPYSSEVSSFTGALHHARVDHFDGSAGRALLGGDSEDPTLWQPIGDRVPPELMRFSWFMPALIFIENWDAEARSGSLVAYNYELDARATIAEGVSSFDLTSYPWEGIVYSVPRGKKQGIWFAKAK